MRRPEELSFSERIYIPEIIAGLFVIINLGVDVLYAVINPRISIK